MIWKNKKINNYPCIILSDCTIKNIQVVENEITVNFSEDGFFVKDINEKKYFRTDVAQLIIESCDIADIEIKEIRTHQLSEEIYYESMYDVEPNEFNENINSGKWKAIVVEEFYGSGGGLYRVHMRSGESYFWCHIKLQFKNLIYLWNEIRYDFPL